MTVIKVGEGNHGRGTTNLILHLLATSHVTIRLYPNARFAAQWKRSWAPSLLPWARAYLITWWLTVTFVIRSILCLFSIPFMTCLPVISLTNEVRNLKEQWGLRVWLMYVWHSFKNQTGPAGSIGLTGNWQLTQSGSYKKSNYTFKEKNSNWTGWSLVRSVNLIEPMRKLTDLKLIKIKTYDNILILFY